MTVYNQQNHIKAPQAHQISKNINLKNINCSIFVYLLTLMLIYLMYITDLILQERYGGTVVQWWFYCGTLIYSMPMVLNDYHILYMYHGI